MASCFAAFSRCTSAMSPSFDLCFDCPALPPSPSLRTAPSATDFSSDCRALPPSPRLRSATSATSPRGSTQRKSRREGFGGVKGYLEGMSGNPSLAEFHGKNDKKKRSKTKRKLCVDPWYPKPHFASRTLLCDDAVTNVQAHQMH